MEKPAKIKLPKGFKPIDIFADCETFVSIDPSYFPKPEDYTDRDYRDAIFRNYGEVIPWLLCFDVPRTGYNKEGKPKILNGRKTECTLFPHEDFWKLLKMIYESGHIPRIWFHNTTYDITSLFPTCLNRLDKEAKIYFHVKDTNNDFINGTIYSPKYGFIALLADTMKYKKISIRKIGEMFETPKGEVAYNICNLSITDNLGQYTNWETGQVEQFNYYDYEKYCRKDVELLARYHKYITEFKETLYNAILGVGKDPEDIAKLSTVGEQAKKMFDVYIYRNLRGNFDDYFRYKVGKLEYYRQYKSNHGGFTSMSHKHPFYRCNDNEKIFYIDINGSYPYVMSRGIPCGKLLNERPKKGNYVVWYRIQVNSFEWKGLLSDFTKIGFGDDRIKHLDKPTFTEADDWHTEKEIYIPELVFNFLKKHANIKYQYRGKFYQRITMIASKFMNDVRSIRNKYKEISEKDPDRLKRLLADDIQKAIKISANSQYGKFCQKSYINERFYVGDQFKDYLKEEDAITYEATLTGAFVTWMARYKLWTKLLELMEAGFKFLYCDTDSVLGVFKTEEIDKLNSIIGVNTNELGQWKIEGFFNEFAYIVSKKYMLIDYDSPEKSKFVFSGLSDLDRWKLTWKQGLLNNFNETLNILRGIFSQNQNWIFINGKTGAIKTAKYAQTIIRVSDFNTNRDLKKVDGYIWLTDEGYGYQKDT